MSLVEDSKVKFPAFFVRAKTKTELRRFVASHALVWLRLQRRRCAKGAIMVDIDDTLIDGHESVANGFQFMKILYNEASLLYPIHVVTARPDDQRDIVMRMLLTKGLCIPSDRLHMLPSHLYGKDFRHVEEFKWKAYVKIGHEHDGVVARFGDKLWDVAHLHSLETYLAHVRDKDCYLFMDPLLKGTYSAKLPGL